jgi:hypothetical protein
VEEKKEGNLKKMKNSVELRQKSHDGSRKTTESRDGKKLSFLEGGEVNVIFGPKYRPLLLKSWDYGI